MTWRNMVQLYVFTDVRAVPALKNLVIDAILTRYNGTASSSRYDLMREIPWIYANTTDSSPLRRLLIHYVV